MDELIARIALLLINIVERAATNKDDATVETVKQALERLEKARARWYGEDPT